MVVPVVAALNVLAWGALSYVGHDVIRGVIEQHAVGYPNAAQIGYYQTFPLVMLVTALALPLVARWKPARPYIIGLQVLSLIVLVPFMHSYTGGV